MLAMQAIAARGAELDTAERGVSEIVRREPYPVRGKAEEILRRLKEYGMTRFQLLFRGSRSRGEIVATFIAVLELCREGHSSGRFRHRLHRCLRGRCPREHQFIKSEERYVFGIFRSARG